MCQTGNRTIYANCYKQASGGKPMSNVTLREVIGTDGSCYGKRGKALKPPKKKR